ncbi:hypothetical protein [Sporosarcina sp. FSL K6-3508]|uniref:hypothetical protein n=1 Tax=Sporosarcina sp. FSL K6-3508 TaxID=2921557 RepID=UPI00315B23C3
MLTANLILGIIASILSITSIIFTKRVSAKNREIEQHLKQELNITLDSSKKDILSSKKAVSGKNGNSIIGDGNNIRGGK